MDSNSTGVVKDTINGAADVSPRETHAEGNVKQSWASILSNRKGAGSIKLNFRPPSVVEGKTIVQLNTQDFAKRKEECEELLVGNFLGRRLAFV